MATSHQDPDKQSRTVKLLAAGAAAELGLLKERAQGRKAPRGGYGLAGKR